MLQTKFENNWIGSYQELKMFNWQQQTETRLIAIGDLKNISTLQSWIHSEYLVHCICTLIQKIQNIDVHYKSGSLWNFHIKILYTDFNKQTSHDMMKLSTWYSYASNDLFCRIYSYIYSLCWYYQSSVTLTSVILTIETCWKLFL